MSWRAAWWTEADQSAGTARASAGTVGMADTASTAGMVGTAVTAGTESMACMTDTVHTAGIADMAPDREEAGETAFISGSAVASVRWKAAGAGLSTAGPTIGVQDRARDRNRKADLNFYNLA